MPTHDELRDDEAQYAAFLAKMCDFYRNGNTCPNANRVAEEAGIPTDHATITRVTRVLRDRGLISGHGSFGGGIGRPSITEAGRMAVTQSFNPPQPGGANISGISMGNNNTVSFMQNSPGATQQTKLEPYMKRDIEEWLDKLVPAAEDLVRSPAHVGDVQQYAERIRGEVVVPEPHRGRVRELLGHIVNVLRPASEASMATAGIIEAGHRLYQMLGQ